MQKTVFDSFLSDGQNETVGVTAAGRRLALAYDMVET